MSVSERADPGAGETPAASPDARAAAARPARPRAEGVRWWAVPAAVIAGGAVLFLCYYRMSATAGANSDGASNALQAWDMLHGNLLLHGWALSDVSFYTTELPEYMLIELVRGLGSDVVHIAGALTYTLLVLAAALLARGRARGTAGWARMAVAAGIMVAPQLGVGVAVLMLTPDHVGTSVPVLAAWLVLDRGGRRRWVPVAVAAILAWTLVADAVVLFIAIAPLLAVSLMRAYREIVQRRRPVAAAWFELSLATAALVAAAIGMTAPILIHALGGYTVHQSPQSFAMIGQMPAHLWLTVQGILLLFGANFFALTLSLGTGLVLLHLAGLALATWAVLAGLRRFAGDRDIIVQLLVAGTVIIVAGYLLGPRVHDLAGTREMAAALPFGAVLAGRLLADRLSAARLMPAAAVVLLGYLLTLGANALPASITPPSLRPASTVPPSAIAPMLPPGNGQIAAWLAARNFRYGLSTYWLANSTTLASGDRVQVRAVDLVPPIAQHGWELVSSWYNPRLHDARFLVLDVGPDGPLPHWSMGMVLRDFGRPARTYDAGPYRVLVWNYNLLTRVG